MATKRQKRVAKYPLRKIIGSHIDPVTNRTIEHLECGHEQPQKQDFMGVTNANARRCRKCFKEIEQPNLEL